MSKTALKRKPSPHQIAVKTVRAKWERHIDQITEVLAAIYENTRDSRGKPILFDDTPQLVRYLSGSVKARKLPAPFIPVAAAYWMDMPHSTLRSHIYRSKAERVKTGKECAKEMKRLIVKATLAKISKARKERNYEGEVIGWEDRESLMYLVDNYIEDSMGDYEREADAVRMMIVDDWIAICLKHDRG